MSILGIVRVGTACAQTAIATAAEVGTEQDAAVLRVGLLQFLKAHADSLVAAGDSGSLLDAYRDWLAVATDLYSGGEVSLRDYSRRAAILSAEMDLAETVGAMLSETP